MISDCISWLIAVGTVARIPRVTVPVTIMSGAIVRAIMVPITIPVVVAMIGIVTVAVMGPISVMRAIIVIIG